MARPTALELTPLVSRSRLTVELRKPRGLALAGLCLLIGACLKLPESIEAPGSDTGMFATYGAMLLHGARPYVDFWDLHPPLVFVYWAVVQSLTGADWTRTCLLTDAIAPQSCAGLLAHVLDLLLSVAAALITAAIVRRAGGSQTAAAVSAVLVVGFADQAMLSQEGSHPSKLTLVPSTLAVWAYLKSHASNTRFAYLAGLASAVAVFAKQPALLTLAALAIHAAWHRDSPRLATLLTGFAVLFGTACGLLAAVGSLDGFINQVWIYNVERVLVGYFVQPAKPPVIGLWRVLAESAGVLAALALLGVVVLIARARLPHGNLLMLWVAVNVVAVTAFREFVYVVPSLAVVAAVGSERVWRYLRAKRSRVAQWLLVGTCTVALAATTGFQRSQLSRARFERVLDAGPSRSEQLGSFIRDRLPLGSLFIYGNGAQLYPLSGRAPATAYLNAEALRSTAPHAEATRADLLASLQRNSPSVIALAPHSDEAELDLANYPALGTFLAECYAPSEAAREIDINWIVLTRTRACT
jgi:hypothetical protein